MRRLLFLIFGLALLGGCNVTIPNGIFSCGQPSDCPSGFFCWSSDSRCYDAEEPKCAPKSCEQIVAEFASLGIAIECGSLPDGCDGTIECGGCAEDQKCGANGQNFVCGCEENTCATFGTGAECGAIPTRCGGDEQAIFCGQCFGLQECVDNKCVCPSGVNCDVGCGSCPAGEVCVDGQCCAPSFPCSENKCSPPAGFDDGCGGVAHCPPCDSDQECVFSTDLVFECVGDCTCEAEGVECGSATVCGNPTLCGTCADNGFGDGFRCDSGKCICEDYFEFNDSFQSFALICGEGTGLNCMQDAWGIELRATLHSATDIDYYALEVLDSDTLLIAELFDGRSNRILHMTYICPDGSLGLESCSAATDSIEGIKFCVAEGDFIGLQRRCASYGSSEMGTLLLGVRAKEFRGDCDPYDLRVFATYQTEIPD